MQKSSYLCKNHHTNATVILLMQAILLLDFACLLNRVSLPRWLPHTPLHRKMITILKIIIIIIILKIIIIIILKIIIIIIIISPQSSPSYLSSRLSWSSPTRLLRTCSLQCSPYTVPAISSNNLSICLVDIY